MGPTRSPSRDALRPRIVSEVMAADQDDLDIDAFFGDVREEDATAKGMEADLPNEIHGEMDIEIEESEGDDDGDELNDAGESALYFSVSIWRARGVLGNNDGGKSSDPYVLAKYGDHEVQTRVVTGDLNPVWKSHIMFQHSPDVRNIQLFVFDFENFMSDDLLGKVTVELPAISAEPVFTVLDRDWVAILPCLTSEQDDIASQQHMTRRVTKTMRVFHDDAHLFKKGHLGEMQLSITCFRLAELPKLVRQREQTIQELRSTLTMQRRMSKSVLQDTTLRLQAELRQRQRESVVQAQRAESAEARLLQAAATAATLADDQRLLNDRAENAERAFHNLQKDRVSDKLLADDALGKAAGLAKIVSTAENERDALKLAVRRLEKQLLQAGTVTAAADQLSLQQLQERIQGLTLAYYWKKRRGADAPMNDSCKQMVNNCSLPGTAQLRLEAPS
ncbi:hypothetical protein M885DRAFT_524052 [Pelagophyceae sp. CCMP2097]|nr:hypothetical protein M885DRAFT_524052 [Pelagophyceae sp. CCMP2097]|mmetsp:Transcript_18704/g.63193  ORF Transcript_18704/g.63193 Transcript_18704/m.63193 type:complete len:448 (-) Transcript_18704:90-1433(-)